MFAMVTTPGEVDDKVPQEQSENMAKAVLDNRMIDLPFSQPFYQWLLGEEATFDVADLKGIDPEIATTAVKLQGIVHKKARLEADRALSASERQEQISQLTMDG